MAISSLSFGVLTVTLIIVPSKATVVLLLLLTGSAPPLSAIFTPPMESFRFGVHFRVNIAYWNATRAFMILSGMSCFTGIIAGILSFTHFSAFERFNRSFSAGIMFFISSESHITRTHTHTHAFLLVLDIGLDGTAHDLRCR
uniref:Uncharacterized protein n=1 Tax=Hucho hucho TaxID=62062 RepID=A0A4W5JIC6_9TELE